MTKKKAFMPLLSKELWEFHQLKRLYSSNASATVSVLTIVFVEHLYATRLQPR
jgi:hypothetical protein